jgi:NitT/TauT family transport system substrate-binding protein
MEYLFMKHIVLRVCAALALAQAVALPAFARQEVVIGIGTQNTTTNTVTGGVVIKEMKLLEKYLPKSGKYKDIDLPTGRTSPPARRSPTA